MTTASIELAGLERSKLPELVPTGSVLGGLAAAAAAELGLLAGTPVVTGTGDLHSAAVGSGAVADFDAHLYIGTSSWISCHVPFKKTDALTNIASIPSGIPGRYLVADEHETGGACLTWLRDNLLFPDDALASGAGHVPDGFFGTLNDMASSVPAGSHGVLFTPWLNGERSPVDDHTIRGGFHNISLSSTRADMVRAVFEGVALNSAWLLGAVEKFCKRRLETLAFVGGGANSDLWSQIHADATGRTIRQVADPVLANVRGAGLLTLLALGHITVADIPGTVQVKATYEPDPAAAEVYAGLLKEFVNLYEKTKGIHKRLNGRRLHQAAPSGPRALRRGSAATPAGRPGSRRRARGRARWPPRPRTRRPRPPEPGHTSTTRRCSIPSRRGARARGPGQRQTVSPGWPLRGACAPRRLVARGSPRTHGAGSGQARARRGPARSRRSRRRRGLDRREAQPCSS